MLQEEKTNKPVSQLSQLAPKHLCVSYLIKIIYFQNGCITPEKKSRSRPPSYAGAGRESPVNIRSRSSTCDSLKSGSSPNTYRQSMAPPPPPQNRKPSMGKSSIL